MTDASEIAAIAGKLTAAQRMALLAMSADYQLSREIPAAGSTLNALWDFRRDYRTTETAIAAPVSLVSRDVCDQPLAYLWCLTPLGLAVRYYLQGEGR